VALAIAHKTGKRVGFDTTTRMAYDASLVGLGLSVVATGTAWGCGREPAAMAGRALVSAGVLLLELLNSMSLVKVDLSGQGRITMKSEVGY
jgi:hypothetical protein